MELRRLRAENTFSFKKIDLDFRKLKNVVIIRGEVDGVSGDSNGAGKTSLFDTINWGCYDKTSKGVKLNDIIRRGTKNCRIDLEFINNNGDLVRVRKNRGSSTKLSVSVNGKNIPYRLKSRMQKYLEDAIGLDFDVWANSILLQQNSLSSFLNGTDVGRKEFLGKLIDISRIDKALSVVRKKKNRLDAEVDELKYVVESIPETSIDVTEYEEVIKKFKKRFNELKEKIRVGRILKYKWIDKKDKKLKSFNGKLSSLVLKKQFEQNKLDVLKARYIKALKGWREAKKSGRCSQCKQDLVTKGSMDEIKKLYISAKRAYKENVSSSKVIIDESEKKIQEIEIVISKIKKKYLASEGKVEEIIRKNEARLTKIITEYRGAKEVIIKSKSASRNKELKNRLLKKSGLLTIYRNAEIVLGPKGFRTILMKDLCGVVEDTTNYYLKILSDGDLSINIDMGDKINIVVRGPNGDMSWECYSGGERKIVEVASSLALAEIVASKWSRFNFLMWDEPFVSLDNNKTERVLSLLSDIAHKHGMKTMITTNQNHIVDYARLLKCSEILVRNVNGISELLVMN